MKQHVIYIPGLGDRYDGLRRRGLWLWGRLGLSTELVPMQWYNGNGSFEDRYQAVVVAIQASEAKGCQVVLVGESAGAAMAISVVAGYPHVGLVTLCGVTSPATPIAPSIRLRSPAFDRAIANLDQALGKLDLGRVDCVRASVDPVIAKSYSLVPGARHHVIWCLGHILTIAACLSLYAPYMVRLIRSKRSS